MWLTRSVDGGDLPSIASTRFSDVDVDDDWWAPYVERLAELGITQGCGSGRYCPDEDVSRQQMATFLVRAFDLAPAGSFGFTDIKGSTHAANIDSIASARITAGCSVNPLRYCPRHSVTRAQMATFLGRALNLIDLPAAPLGTQIAFVSDRDGDNEIFTMHHSGAQQQQITDNTQSDWGPQWSPAAPHILYNASIDGSNEIFVVNTTGDRPPRQLTFNGGSDPAWSPDGTEVAFIRAVQVAGRGSFNRIHLINANGTQLLTLSDAYCVGRCSTGGWGYGDRHDWSHYYDPTWSPDGKHIISRVVHHDSGPLVEYRSLVLTARSGSGSSGVARWDGREGLYDPVWAPVGNRIAYSQNGISVRSVRTATVKPSLRLTDHGTVPVWSPDGTRIAFISANNIWVVHVDGSILEQITFLGARNAAWSPDGTRIAFDSARDGDFEIYVVDVDGTNLRQLTYNDYEDFDPDW